jgi:hypothetical protein
VELNHRPSAYQADALTGELQAACRPADGTTRASYRRFHADIERLAESSLFSAVPMFGQGDPCLRATWLSRKSCAHYYAFLLRGGGASNLSVRKEVIQPQVPLRLPCYDLVPITSLALGAALLTVGQTTSSTPRFRGLTGGVYKAQEHIHRGMADPRLLAIPAS